MPPTTVTASVRMAKQCCAILPIVSSTNSRCLTRVESMGRLSPDPTGPRPAHGPGEQDGPGEVKIARAKGNFPIQVLFILALYEGALVRHRAGTASQSACGVAEWFRRAYSGPARGDRGWRRGAPRRREHLA